ncbi:hypothetical protein PFTANZ_06618 [Plasmodium falciparum Tanzania (2000708)]|uniref:Duffy-binding-like domain-containing protein n=1 Tax=Plasmodium falciparum Tanzania (2000708) TaxID=1036725 RepID=A0A024VXL4_PLAFA|nr:hypothetical protein PFTANZ_06618 [Plasmodium falciparum Tanzania (2000708)]
MARGRLDGGSPQEEKDKYKYVNDAKELLDKIGEEIYKKAKDEALTRSQSKLKGFLTSVVYQNDERSTKSTPNDPCKLDHKYDTNVTGGFDTNNPCANRPNVRFSDIYGGQCTRNRIKDSTSDTVGACAPLRRLFLCDHHLSYMKDDKINNTHNLLLEVLLAAKFEGESITREYPKYQIQYASSFSTSQICTMLARSFADIGDIIRGKDLYLRDKGKRDKLENNLKKIFAKIHENLGDTTIKSKYNDDTDKNYYKLREDWWALNREEVWKAITCGHPDGTYFRNTCAGGTTPTPNKCRCATNDVPTYFDYVPQYLRWFEEWAEDFCRKRKYKLENAKEQCRGPSGTDRYCSRNGYDCTQTIRGKDILVEGDDCTKCSVVCTPFVDWIENKQKEFEKQKEKYDDEIKKANGTSNGTTTTSITIGDKTINNLYVGDFYSKLQQTYGDVEKFLQKLNDEKTCKGHPEVGEEKASNVDFTKDPGEIFSHKEYCDTCPWCAKKVKKEGKWKDGEHESGCPNNVIKDLDDKNTTDIDLLVKDTSGTNIVEKLKSLCNGSNLKYNTWKCYYQKGDQKRGIRRFNDCILQNDNKNIDKPENRTIHSFNSLFWQWVTEMLKDSIDWSKELDSCIKKGDKSTCISGCKSKCDCFEKWVKRMKEEWEELEKHYLKENFGQGISPYGTLEGNLQNSYLEMIQKTYKNVDFAKEIEQIIQKNKANILNATKDNNSITKFLQHEAQEAQKCVTDNPEKNCKPKERKPPPPEPPAGGGVARSNTVPSSPQPGTPPLTGDDHDSSSEDEEEEEEKEEEEENHKATEGTGAEEKAKEEEKKDACEIVEGILEEDHGNGKVGECNPKDYQGKAYPGWDCENNIDTNHTGACMPPRRQKLCLHYLAHEKQTQNIKTQDHLREAFIKTAAAETFLAWQYYKSKHGNGANELIQNLKKGQIPPEFLRSMFYTFGDYRDICLDTDISKKLPGSDVKKAKDKIDQIFPKNDGKRDDKERENFWKQNGRHIWKGMLCGLSHASGNENNAETIKSKNTYANVKFSDNKTTLEEFAQTPQFLRWFTEWGEDFCKQRELKVKELEKGCAGYVCNGENMDDKKKNM